MRWAIKKCSYCRKTCIKEVFKTAMGYSGGHFIEFITWKVARLGLIGLRRQWLLMGSTDFRKYVFLGQVPQN